METYHKINALFKRHKDGPKKDKLIVGDWAVPEFEYLANNEWEFTEKVDGTNIRIGYNGNGTVTFAGRSDNASIPQPLMDHLIYTFRASVFDNAGLEEVTLYGEGYGPKIQGGGKYRSDHSFVLFDVKIGDFWLRRDDVNDIASKLGIESVPTIGTGTLGDAIDIVSTGLTWNTYGKMTNWGGFDAQSKKNFNGLKSQWGDFEAEGIVARPAVPLFNRMGERVITKIKAVDFK